MENDWALVVGVNEYPGEPQLKLSGGIGDALNIVEWLLRDDGGAIPAQNLYLLTSPPQQDQGSLPAGVKTYGATFKDLVTAVKDLIDRQSEPRNRLYFYFSGHGINNNSGLSLQEALCLSDFSYLETDNAVEIASLYQYFQCTRFKEQIFIIDACRNLLPKDVRLRTRPFTLLATPDESFPAPAQYTLQSTAPWQRSFETIVGGAFTNYLLAGLAGTGNAKRFDSVDGDFKVSVDTLFKYVKARLRAFSEATKNTQVPSMGGVNIGDDPLLARFQMDAVPKEPLSITIEPQSPWGNESALKLIRDGLEVSNETPLQDSYQLDCTPGPHRVLVNASNFHSAQKSYPVEIYEATELLIKMLPIRVSTGSTGVLPPSPVPRAPAIVDLPPPPPPPPPSPVLATGQITIDSSDPLATLDLIDVSGRTIRTAYGKLTISGLDPGLYRARLIAPEGGDVEQLIQLDPGESENVHVKSPKLNKTRIFQEVTELIDSRIVKGSSLDVATQAMPIAAPALSTILALAGASVNLANPDWGFRLRKLRLRSFNELTGTEAKCGIHLIAATETGTPDKVLNYLGQVNLRLWPFHQRVPQASGNPQPVKSVVGLSEFAQVSDPGLHWFKIEWPNSAPAVFVLPMLESFVTMLIFHRDVTGTLRAFRYTVPHGADSNSDPVSLRRLDLAQRFYWYGRMDRAYDVSLELAKAGFIDPIAACLAGYVMLRVGKLDALSEPVNFLIDRFPDLSDGHILKAEFEAGLGNVRSARESYVKALAVGVPMFAAGIDKLSNALNIYQLADDADARLIRKIRESQAAGYIWTVCTRDVERVGTMALKSHTKPLN